MHLTTRPLSLPPTILNHHTLLPYKRKTETETDPILLELPDLILLRDCPLQTEIMVSAPQPRQ